VGSGEKKRNHLDAAGLAELCVSNYAEALELAKAHLSPIDPLRLAIALNYSVCVFDILHDPNVACAIAQAALIAAEEALADEMEAAFTGPAETETIFTLPSTDEMGFNREIMLSLLRDNLVTWSNDI
jgi:hypothetical protein